MYCEENSRLTDSMSYYESLAQKMKKLYLYMNDFPDQAPAYTIELIRHYATFIEMHFEDQNRNFMKWIKGEPCFYVHPKTKNKIEVKIGNDDEAIIRFLNFCWQLQHNIEIDDDELAYLAYIIARSNSNGEEC